MRKVRRISEDILERIIRESIKGIMGEEVIPLYGNSGDYDDTSIYDNGHRKGLVSVSSNYGTRDMSEDLIGFAHRLERITGSDWTVENDIDRFSHNQSSNGSKANTYKGVQRTIILKTHNLKNSVNELIEIGRIKLLEKMAEGFFGKDNVNIDCRDFKLANNKIDPTITIMGYYDTEEYRPHSREIELGRNTVGKGSIKLSPSSKTTYIDDTYNEGRIRDIVKGL